MTRWTAASDFDYYDETQGRRKCVDRTCAQCGRVFLVQVADREYELHPWCEPCQAQARVSPQELAERH